ncbi:hypothetical protein G6011_01072 [Alternaria panax]|uniref:Transcription factor domain-containing protein n=1 Tax=Alternaria panax TaxID=48097 RepID=A0AAD4NU83_9PLEO|nr:hypothetical protein G6011_01072 [Alternaria panax]
MAYFPELRVFMKGVYHNSTAQRLAQDMMSVGKRTSADISPYNIVSVSSLRDLLPDRPTTDRLVQKYFSTFETTYRILHIPTFQEAYERYWDVAKPGFADMDAIVELELQASIDKGINIFDDKSSFSNFFAGTASVACRLESDCAAPANINDAQLHSSLEELPPSQPVDVFTDTSFLFVSMRSRELRSRPCTLANSLQSKLSFQDTLSHANAIQEHLGSIPTWTDPRSLQARTLLDLQLRQLSVILYAAMTADLETTTNTEHQFSSIALLEAATVTASLHTALTASSNLAVCCARSDYYRAALWVCHIAYYASKNNDAMVAQVAKTALESCVEQALNLLEERVMLTGRGSQQNWVLSAAVGLVNLQFEPLRSDAVKLQAIDRVSRLLYKMLSRKDINQQLPANEILLQDTLHMAKQVDSHSGHFSSEAPSIVSFTDTGLRVDAFDLGETSEWMSDDFWFLNEPFENVTQIHGQF